MQITDLNEKHLQTYYHCLEDWSDEMKEAGNHKEQWYQHMKDKGLRVKVAIVDDCVAGMIQYVPVENSFIQGQDLFFILCIWVHGYKKGIGNFQKKGIGIALLKAAEEDVHTLSAKGIAAWGVTMPFWMKASWFKKQGFKVADKTGFLGTVLLWKKFSVDAEPPKWIPVQKEPEAITDKVTVTAYITGWCPVYNLAFERAKRASSEFGDKVVFQGINTFNNREFIDRGISDALYINGKTVNTGPPPSYEKIKRKIAKQIKT